MARSKPDLFSAFADKNLVTADAYPVHPEWISRFLDLLGTKIEP